MTKSALFEIKLKILLENRKGFAAVTQFRFPISYIRCSVNFHDLKILFVKKKKLQNLFLRFSSPKTLCFSILWLVFLFFMDEVVNRKNKFCKNFFHKNFTRKCLLL